MVGHFDDFLWVLLQCVPSLFQDTLYHVVIVCPEVRCAPAGIVQSPVPYLLGQVEYAKAGFIGLFGMLFLVEYPDDISLTGIPDMPRPGDELLAAPLADEPMVRGHMFRHGGVPVLLPFPCMGGQAFVPVVYLDEAIGVDDLDLLADMPVGYAVVVLVPAKIDVAVLVDGSLGVRSYLVPLQWQGLELLPFHLLEQRVPGVLPPPERPVVVRFQELRYGIVDIGLAVESAVSQRRENAGIDYPDGIFDDGLVPRSVSPCRQYGRFIVLGEVGEGIVYLGLIAAALGNGRFEVVRYQRTGHAPVEPKGVLGTAHEVFQFLAGTGLDIGILAASQNTYEDLEFLQLPGIFVHDTEFLAGKIDEELVAGLVGKVHHGGDFLCPFAVPVPEL